MVLIYFGTTGCADSDFPLIRALQSQGIDVYSYFYVDKYNASSGLFNIRLKHCNSIIPAYKYEGLKVYENYLDLNKTFIINRYYWGRRNFQYWIYKPLWERVFRHMRKRQPKILHFTWPLYGEQKILYHLNAKIVQTVHDPFPHSGQYTSEGEADRIEAFQHADSLVFLSTPQLGPFCMHYNVDKSKVLLNRMGEFDHLKLLSHSSYNDVNNPYILYIGQIQEHKGIDILLKSMLKLHQSHPEDGTRFAIKLNIEDMKNAYLFLLLIAATLCSCQITTKQASAKMPDLIGRWQTEAMDLGSQQVTEEFFFQDDKNLVMSIIIHQTYAPKDEPLAMVSLNGTYQLTDSICSRKASWSCL